MDPIVQRGSASHLLFSHTYCAAKDYGSPLYSANCLPFTQSGGVDHVRYAKTLPSLVSASTTFALQALRHSTSFSLHFINNPQLLSPPIPILTVQVLKSG